ncbi:RNA polymerase sigma24 factor [Rhizocola hellebori]|uniref:RNA polymerase sigma24 factor n=1 Tax=Rhizocola hellebori TaxID=1392758 RepID=A0A8J3QDI2_9ACTN|nr:RNA polymerase sigma factor [Rhizocola hellebori]GIH07642.1 RNA polymerase sigma24 factor [Rhizocola hellebori]
MTENEPNPATDDLSSAVQAARGGDEAAFRALYRAIQPGLLRYLQLLVGADAEDVASETWLQVVRDLSSFKGDGLGFRRWAVTIGRHRALDHVRHHQRRPAIAMPVEAMVEMPDRSDTASAAMEVISTDAALAMIATLPRDQAEAVLLRVVVGLDAESAAVVLGKRSGAVRTAAYRGLRRLNDALGHSRDDTAE